MARLPPAPAPDRPSPPPSPGWSAPRPRCRAWPRDDRHPGRRAGRDRRPAAAQHRRRGVPVPGRGGRARRGGGTPGPGSVPQDPLLVPLGDPVRMDISRPCGSGRPARRQQGRRWRTCCSRGSTRPRACWTRTPCPYGVVAANLARAGREHGEREGPWYNKHIKVHEEYAGMTATAREIREHGCPGAPGPFTSQMRDPDQWRYPGSPKLAAAPCAWSGSGRTRPPSSTGWPPAVRPRRRQAVGLRDVLRPACGRLAGRAARDRLAAPSTPEEQIDALIRRLLSRRTALGPLACAIRRDIAGRLHDLVLQTSSSRVLRRRFHSMCSSVSFSTPYDMKDEPSVT